MRRRYAAKSDASQREVIATLRAAKVKVWVMREPCDLLCRFWSNEVRRFLWQPIECKPTDLKNAKRKDQPEQKAFVEDNDVPVVRTGEEALRALGVA